MGPPVSVRMERNWGEDLVTEHGAERDTSHTDSNILSGLEDWVDSAFQITYK